jgi:hypothetical protein
MFKFFEKGNYLYITTKGVFLMGKLLWWIICILIAFWLLGLLFKIGGGLIHIILVIAGIMFFVQLLAGKKSL